MKQKILHQVGVRICVLRHECKFELLLRLTSAPPVTTERCPGSSAKSYTPSTSALLPRRTDRRSTPFQNQPLRRANEKTSKGNAGLRTRSARWPK